MADKKTKTDVIIVGAGPAGLSAAIWCSDLGLDAVVLENGPEKGGQLLNIYNQITNYPGLAARNGRELRDRFLATERNSRTNFFHNVKVIDIDLDEISVRAADGREYDGRAILLATGVRRRQLGIPGESEFLGKGVLISGVRDRLDVSEKTVAVIGGGDAALENSAILAETAKRVYVIHRREDFRARREFVTRAGANPKVKLILNTVVSAIRGDDNVGSVDISDNATGTIRSLQVDRVLIRIGVEPNSELLQGKADLDGAGYVVVDRTGLTSVPNLYAAGDVAHPVSPTIVTSVGSAAAAIKAIARRFSEEVIQ